MKPAHFSSWSQAELDSLLDARPYARYLGIRLAADEQGMYCHLPCRDDLIGNPLLPAYHGGVVGTILEMAAEFHLATAEACRDKKIHLVSFDIDYLRPAFGVDIYARAHTVRIGKSVANIRAEAWQHTPEKPVAVGKGNYLLLAPG